MFSRQFFLKFSFLIVLFTVSCGSSSREADEQKKDNFFVTGTIVGGNGQKVYLEAASQGGTIAVAEALIENEKFDLKTNIPGLGIYQLRFGNSPENSLLISGKENDKINIQGDISSISMNAKISGVDWGNDYSQYMTLISEFSQKQNDLMQLRDKYSQQDLMKKYLEIKQPLDEFSKNYVMKNPSSSFNLVLSNNLLPTAGFEHYPQENLEALKLMSDSYLKNYSDSPFTKTLAQQVAQIESGIAEYELIASGKKPAPEIDLKSPEGNVIKLSSLKGKVVLIDFWASWCAPCRKENPNVVRLYNKYKNKGFTIYSVSLDTDVASWVNAIEQDGLIWPNHVSDLKGWKTFLVKLYKFQGIPHTVLVGKDGNIIAEGLRGQELENKLAELLR